KSVEEILKTTAIADVWEEREAPKVAEEEVEYVPGEDEELDEQIARLEAEMYEAAERLEFERAARLRDRIRKLEEMARRR
ncbi:MAG TPA: excinuclease ABC subunit B, partial [Firmicutes bacterium]|nr:excinuclease ABC subunit B [Bacillota bacterium]